MPPTARRRPPPLYASGPRRRHGRRRLLVLILILATVGAAGYLYLNRGSTSGGSTTDFVQIDRRVIADAEAIPVAAQQVHRFAELHDFDGAVSLQVVAMTKELAYLRAIARGASGNQKAIADQAVTTVQQTIDAAERYHKAVAFTYRLADADTAVRDLYHVISTLQQQINAWQHG